MFTFGGASNQFNVGNTPILFYSRRIGLERGLVVPIIGGGRLTGRMGRYTLGLINIQTDEEQAVAADPTNFSVVRVRRDILRRSSIGVLMTGRRAGEDNRRTASTDAGFFQSLSTTRTGCDEDHRTSPPRRSGQLPRAGRLQRRPLRIATERPSVGDASIRVGRARADMRQLRRGSAARLKRGRNS
jgi:hypothetical protein